MRNIAIITRSELANIGAATAARIPVTKITIVTSIRLSAQRRGFIRNPTVVGSSGPPKPTIGAASVLKTYLMHHAGEAAETPVKSSVVATTDTVVPDRPIVAPLASDNIKGMRASACQSRDEGRDATIPAMISVGTRHV